MPLTPAAAAERAGVSRSLISKAIKSGSLAAQRGNNGHLTINEPDLEAWMQRRPSRGSAPVEAPAGPAVAPVDDGRVTQLTAELAAANALLGEVRQDRDEWRARADKAADQLAEERKRIDQLIKDMSQPRSLWSRILGR